MTVEATVTRELDISFIDARKLTTIAKLNLGMTGYPNATQSETLLREVKRIFRKELPREERRRMRATNVNLVDAKKLDDMSSSSSTQSESLSSTGVSLSSSSSCSTGLVDGGSLRSSNKKKSWVKSSKAASMSIDDLSRVNHSWRSNDASSLLSPARSANKAWRPGRPLSLSPMPHTSSMSSSSSRNSASRSPLRSKTKERLLCIMTGSSNPQQQAGNKSRPSGSAAIAA
eukprot:CAMPEP_0117011326 /NCGR_PEP_ID=MMETSP0472-20121206/9760_1 /TAXON_ID=693140 ORGANISM="Tiarina fusus, Strain LIS" /NCGR_SAMPLE_ID=MMETSP0472 /ASSEMBLY_ACC=CAM_ASM_000603 /LENGTH=229 /DNA_ID=CAMNT_0004714091 /DNA_START=56 /DNA_END=745 /DNA_ORIENTATION=-